MKVARAGAGPPERENRCCRVGHRLGELLASSPAGGAGTWPVLAVRKPLEPPQSSSGVYACAAFTRGRSLVRSQSRPLRRCRPAQSSRRGRRGLLTAMTTPSTRCG